MGKPVSKPDAGNGKGFAMPLQTAKTGEPSGSAAGRLFPAYHRRGGNDLREKTLFQLGKRLGLCAAMVRPGCRLADIGTDHGYLPVWLAKTGAILSAVAADVREGPLQSARQNIERNGVQDQVTACLSDGLDRVSPQEADDIVIAGMGGELIARLVDRAAWLRDPQKHLILQPMSSAEDLRAFLLEKGFGVFREEAVQEDNHLYSVMLVWYDPEQAARCGRDPSFLHRGLVDGSTPQGKAYLAGRAASLRKRANGLRHTGEIAQAEALETICSHMEQEAGEGSAAT